MDGSAAVPRFFYGLFAGSRGRGVLVRAMPFGDCVLGALQLRLRLPLQLSLPLPFKSLLSAPSREPRAAGRDHRGRLF